MATGRNNSLTSRLAEHSVCAELARRGLIATTFTHNVPKFDVLAADKQCRTAPIQVKATNTTSWRTSADAWMEIELDKAKKTQSLVRTKQLDTPDLIWVCVAVAPVGKRDQFFILTERDIQQICVCNYRTMLESCEGHRPRNWESLDCWWNTSDLTAFENNWELVVERLKSDKPDRAFDRETQ